MSEAKKLPQYIAAVCVCIGALGSGTVLGWTSNITDDLKAGKLGGLEMTDFQLSWVGSLVPLGAMFICMPVGWMADVIGRKLTVLFSSIPFIIGWLLMTFPAHIGMVYAGRLLTGIAGGSFCVTAPLYTSEIAQTDIRGRLGGENYNPADEIKVIQEQIAKDQSKKNFWEAMGTKAAKKATVICFMLMFYQQMSGINAVIFYSKDIFTAAESSVPSHWCTIIIGAVQVVATLVSAWSIEKVGRKVLLIISDLFMAISCFLLGVFFSIKNHELADQDTIKAIAFIPILSLVIFIIAFSLGSGPIPWLASSEIFPPDVMAKCSSAAGAFNWFLAYLVTMFYHTVATTIGNDITFYIFAGVSATGVFFVLLIIPETKGKTFAEIQAELSGE
ncbi:hypothetical protein NQ314_012890 [Rhamnusium bicolor]|uniref:Major facilitator superfamily (MFS) profile domain-containing protein n=1 Tax=Rhamnusium bicolor TaxID=1586634 RepID=A0AAV8X8P0_9CUCU|nr:hypothetical protein NQ314_012890 [Rhamnusium bicolor]